MSPEVSRLWFRVAFIITLLSVILLFFQRPGTAEFVVTALSLFIGVVFLAIIIVLVRLANRP